MVTGAPRGHGLKAVLVTWSVAWLLLASAPARAHAQRVFQRGDSNDDASVDISDALFSLGFLFLGTAEPPCADAADANDDGAIDISDASFTLGYLFLGSSAPPAPGPDVAGLDPTEDGQGCGPPVPAASLHEPWSEPPASAQRQVNDDNKDVARKTDRDEAARRHSSLGTCEWEDIVLTGQVRRRETDIRVPGRGLDLAWVRTYRSSGGPSTAMGHGWDFSYNIWVEPLGGSPPASVRLHDGGGRADELARRPDGLYVAPGVLLEGKLAADGVFIVTFADQGTWRCHPLDASPLAGKIAEIRDRTGNRLTFAYDDAGRLVRILDTLDRTCDVSYDEDGMISGLRLTLWIDKNGDGTVTRGELDELEERTVSYSHISRNSVSGSRGDLRRVVIPVVPAGNPAAGPPVARSHSYTYTTGSPDDELNHNLLTVTDEAGRIQVRNEYQAIPGIARLQKEGIVHRDIAARSLSFSYAGGGGGGGAGGLLTIVRDGLGNVSDYLHDEHNRLVRLREHTGRADPALPTTETENRPAGKLRPADPDFYETSFEYNEDSILTRTLLPNGSSVHQVIEVPPTAGSTLSRGNVLARRTLPGPLAGEQAELVEQFEYHALYNRVTREVDARGNSTTYEYDAAGNRVKVVFPGLASTLDQTFDEHGQLLTLTCPDNGSGHRPQTTYTYSDWSPVALKVSRDIDSDADGTPDTVSYVHDALGNVVRVVDARGNVVEYDRNLLGEVIALRAPGPAPGTPHTFVWHAQRDAGGNLTRTALRDGKDPGQFFLQFFEYDDWNRCVRHYRQASDISLPPGGLDGLTSVPLDQLDRFVVAEYGYDAAGDLAHVTLESGGKQPDPQRNIAIARDERGLPYQVTRGAGSPDAATVQYGYTPNGRLRGYQKEPGKLEVPDLVLSHDGYDRPVRAVDAMGNVELRTHDPNGNVTSVVVQGELLDVEGDAANLELERTDYAYDALDRCVRVEEYLDVDPVPEAARRRAITTCVLTDLGELSLSRDPNGNETHCAYDDAGRLTSVSDAEGNAVRFEYDASDNLVRTTQLDREPGKVRETPWIHKYDALERRVSSQDADGNTTSYSYDYRSFPVSARDALGNVTELKHDLLGRCMSSSRLLTDPATGELLEELTRRQIWDASSRLTSVIDENGNVTSYTHDALDRCSSMTQADGSVASVRYDAFDSVVEATDPNGTRVVSGYDRLHRLTRNSIVPGPGVSGDTTFEDFAHDGLSRLVRAADDDSSVSFTHDPLSRVVSETLNGLTTSYTHDGAGNVLSIRTPGGHKVEYEYDALNRMRAARTVGAGQVTEILSRTFAGPTRLATLSHQNGVHSSFEYDPLLRPSRSTHAATNTVGGLTPFEDRGYAHDGAYRRTLRQSLLPDGLVQTYEYDAASRLVRSTYTTPQQITPIVYFLDAAGNRKQVDGGPDAGPYTLDATLPEPADRQVNQYTTTPRGGRLYDRNGNLQSLVVGGRATRTLEHDFAGRLVAVSDVPSATTARYRYDALGRRWGHEISKGIIGNIRARVFAGGNVVEERDEHGQPVSFIDYAADGLPARQVCCADLDGDGAPDLIHFFHTDDAGNVTAVTDELGQLIERYEYGDHGRPRVLDAAGNPLAESAIGNPFLLAGSWYDAETGYFLVGNEAPAAGLDASHYDPHTGTEIGQQFAVWPHMHQLGTHRRSSLGPIRWIAPEATHQNTAPSLHTAAHEAAHVVQQRGGVQLRTGGAPKKSFASKLGGVAKGVAQVGLGVAGASGRKKMMGAPKIGEATAVIAIAQAGGALQWVETVWNKQCVEKEWAEGVANGAQDINRGVLGLKAKAWMVNNYEVHPVFGLKTEWITSIGLPKITPKIAKESHGRLRQSSADGLDEDGDCSPFATTSPDPTYVDTFTLRGPLTSGRKALCQWINEVVEGKPWKRALTITELLSVDGGVKPGRVGVWKEVSPAEEQLKASPRH